MIMQTQITLNHQSKHHNQQQVSIQYITLYQLFQQTNRIATLAHQPTGGNQKMTHNISRLQNISKFLKDYLSNQKHKNTKEFISCLSILIDLIPALEKYKLSLNFNIKFYRSIQCSLRQLISLWRNHENKDKKMVQIQTTLFICSRLCILANKNHNKNQFKWDLLLNNDFLKMLVQFDLYTSQNAITSYKIVIFYYLKKNKKNLSNPQIYNATIKHLLKFQQNQSNRYDLFQILDYMKTEKLKFVNSQDLNKIISLLKLEIINNTLQNIRKLQIYFSVLSKLIQAQKEQAFLIGLAPNQLLHILPKIDSFDIQESVPLCENIYCFCMKSVKKFSKEEQFSLFKKLMNFQQLNQLSFSLDIIAKIANHLEPSQIVQYVQEGEWHKLIEHSSYIIQNQGNKELIISLICIADSLSNLKQYPQIQYIMRQMMTTYLDSKSFWITKNKQINLQ